MKDISELIILLSIGSMAVFGTPSKNTVEKAQLNNYAIDTNVMLPVNIDSLKKSIDLKYDSIKSLRLLIMRTIDKLLNNSTLEQ